MHGPTISAISFIVVELYDSSVTFLKMQVSGIASAMLYGIWVQAEHRSNGVKLEWVLNVFWASSFDKHNPFLIMTG